MYRFLLTLFLTSTFFVQSKAQQIQIQSTVDAEVEVCQNAQVHEVYIQNLTGSTLTGVTVAVDLPQGITYVTSSVLNLGSGVAVESNVADLNAPVFSAGDIAHGDSLKFSFEFKAGMDAIAWQDAGNLFRNNVQVSANESAADQLSPSYNILYPVLTILDVSPTTQTMLSGGNSVQRTIEIINGGNGKTEAFKISDVRNNPALTYSSADIGTLNGDTLLLSGADFTQIGNGDQYFDQYESITITQTFDGTSCSDVTVTSDIKAHWGCESEISTSSSYAHVTIDFQNPNLKLIANEELNSCFGSGTASVQELIVVNTGAGLAAQIQLDLFKSSGNGYDQSIFSRFDPASLKLKTASSDNYSSYSNYTTTATINSGEYACLGSNPIGQLLVNLPDMLPGDSLFLTWDMYSCCIQTCNDEKVKGWDAEVDYTDVCSVTQYSKSLSGQGTNSQEMSFFTETPVEIYDGEPTWFNFIVSSFNNTLPQGNNAHYVVTFTLESGLVYQDLEFVSNGISWVPFEVNTSTPNTVIAKFAAPAPFTVPKSELRLLLMGDCGVTDWKTVGMTVGYVIDDSCPSCEFPLECDLSVSTYLNCPVSPCDALKFYDFDISRTSFGAPDNNHDGVADASGSLDLTKIKLNRAMVGDTIAAVAHSTIEGVGLDWAYAAFESSVDFGNVLSVVDGELIIYDASSASYYTVSGIPATNVVSGNQNDFNFDLSASVLATLNPALASYQYESGDSLTFTAKYKVDASVTGDIKETTFINQFYLSTVANPSAAQKEFCDQRNGRVTLIGYSFRNNSANNVTVTSCSKVVSQNWGMAIGDGGSNYAGGNLFPFEYRSWGKLKEAWMIIPANYSHVNTRIRQTRTVKTNSKSNQTLNSISPDQINGDTLYFNVDQYYANNSFNYSDDGFNGWIQVELAPNCFVPQDTYQEVEWIFNYEKTAAIDGQETGSLFASSNDQIRFKPTQLGLSSNNPWVDANQRKIVWDYKIASTSSSATDYTWIHIDAPNNIQIDSIVNDANGQVLATQSDLYLVGSINGNSTADLTIHGTFSNCDTVLFTVYSGYECTGYPNSFAEFNCNIEQLVLYVEPKPSNYQQRISTDFMSDPCSPQVEVLVDVTSVKMAHMYDMEVAFITPDTNKIKLVDGTVEWKYNMSSAFTPVTTPVYNSGQYNFNTEVFEQTFELEGVPGVLDINNNQYQIKSIIELGSQFQSGDYLEIQISGANACDVNLPTRLLAVDPNAKFKKDQTAGLHLDIGESWSASWGDYDNDGFDDLFVPVKTLNEPNILYHNNGDGTFTKITSGAIVTDLGASVSGTWGDYDNDGYIDLFVANNENSQNKLYHNNGDGTFTSVQNNPIVDKGIYSHSAAWADYNKDGYLDLVVSDFHPTNFNFLFYGDGQGGFTEDENSPVALSATSAVGVAWGDYDNDGDLDLFIANTNDENNQLFRNDNGEFVEITAGDLVNDGGHSVGGTWGDYDNDGDLDLYVTNSRDVEPNFLYANNGDGTFTKITNNEVVNNISNSHGASWIDFDNDGDLDLLVANDQDKQNYLYSNNGDGTFTSLVNAITQDLSNSYGSAWSDFDNDGDYDLFVANVGSNANDFYINEKGSCTNHLSVKLEGCNSNSYGIGAMISVKADINGTPIWQTRHVSTQTSAMGGQNSNKILFGLLNSTVIDSVVVKWPSGIQTIITNPAINAQLIVQEDCGSRVCGVVYYDENNNQLQDAGEPGVPNQEITVQPGNFQVYTNENGEYQFWVVDDSYTVSLVTNGSWVQTSTPTNYTVNVDMQTATEYCGNDFGVNNTCQDPDLKLNLGTAAFRKGLTNDVTISIENRGVADADQAITLEVEMTDNVYLVDGGWTNVTELNGMRTYVYDITTINTLEDTVLLLVDSVANNALIDEAVTFSATLIYDGNECDLSNNTKSLNDLVVGSIDPNDKLVFVLGKGPQQVANTNDTLLYKIRFQNVGNYAARRVFIADTLSNDLDWLSFEFVSSSHPFTYSLKNGVLTFVNENIELPDSTSDLEGSQGYVMFSIKPIDDIKPYQKVKNTAAIQFDYNEFIITNSADIVIKPAGNDELYNAFAYPNPTEDMTTVILLDDQFERQRILSYAVYDVSGRVLDESDVDDSEVSIDLNDKMDGLYIIELTASNQEKYQVKVNKR